MKKSLAIEDIVARTTPALPPEEGNTSSIIMHRIAILIAFIFAIPAYALQPSEIFLISSPSVVAVFAEDTNSNLVSGSGVALRANIVATNCHTIHTHKKVYIQYKKQNFEAALHASDLDRDVCILRIEQSILQPAEIAKRHTTYSGDKVYSIGSPRGLENTISEGLLSGLRVTEHGELIQTSAAISPGSSGGGLFNSDGELLGLTTFFLKDSQNLNFAVPVYVATNLITEEGRMGTKKNPIDTDKTLKSTIISEAPPIPAFDSMKNRLSYLKWQKQASEKLTDSMLDPQARSEFLQTVWYESEKSQIDPSIVLGLIEKASNFRRLAVSEAGARGYMQVHQSWATRLGLHDEISLFQTQVNLRYGCVIMRHYIEQSNGDLRLALARFFNQLNGIDSDLENPKALAFSKAVLKASERWIN